MKYLLTITLIVMAFSLHGQGDIMQLMFEVNSQPEKINGYSKMVTLSYGISYDEDAMVDTTLINADGSNAELVLNKKIIVVFDKNSEIKYDIDMSSGDTSMVTTSVYNSNGKLLKQTDDMGDDEMAAMFNNTKEFTYDDKGRVLSIMNTAGGESNGGTFTYNDDGLPQSLNMDMGIGSFNVERKDMDSYIKYELGGEMSKEMEEMMAMMGKTMDDMPKEYFELRKKEDLYEIKHMKEEGEEKKLTLQATTLRDIDGKLHEEIKYRDGEITDHTRYNFIDEKLTSITDVLENTEDVIEYDKDGNQLNSFENFARSKMTYNAEGMVVTKSSSSMFSDGINALEVVKYYK